MVPDDLFGNVLSILDVGPAFVRTPCDLVAMSLDFHVVGAAPEALNQKVGFHPFAEAVLKGRLGAEILVE
ncbi:hypothetical protein B0H66DRAFT_608526 [Apodospora peruviana]|uniref:Uncharacterized protein n=1 Tax=Apodospora peruviana TaxID=516989 RepID=A0AAE0LYB4_9PEZI|nr:hypothetical protein B0H66DRAFT_608526 [Apodospora peruviana]